MSTLRSCAWIPTCRPSPSGGSRFPREREIKGRKKKKKTPNVNPKSRIYHPSVRTCIPLPASPTNTTPPSKKNLKFKINMRPFTKLPRLLRHPVVVSSRHGSSASSERWTARATRDPFTKEAQLKGYKSRAAMKLIEMNQKHKLFSAGMTVVDLVRHHTPPRLCGEGGRV